MNPSCDAFTQACSSFGTTAEAFSETLFQYSQHIPPISELDIALVIANPSLSWFQRKVFVHKMKKIIQKTDK